MKDILSLRQALFSTINYFDLFDFPLTSAELSDYLYGWSAPAEVIEEALRGMPEVSHAHGYWFLKGRESIAELRKEQKALAENLWRKADKYAWLFALCPFVRMAAVCNSLAFDNVKKTSDIDLFVVVSPGRLATSRFFMKLFTHVFGVRAHHEKTAGRFCLSFFASEAALDLGKIAREFDPYLAYFAHTVTPLFGEQAYVKFLHANEQWTGKYFRRKLAPRMSRMRKHPVAGFFRFVSELILRIFGPLPERLFAKLQAKKDLERKKLCKNAWGIVLHKDMFKFHENDLREEIAERFGARMV